MILSRLGFNVSDVRSTVVLITEMLRAAPTAAMTGRTAALQKVSEGPEWAVPHLSEVGQSKRMCRKLFVWIDEPAGSSVCSQHIVL